MSYGIQTKLKLSGKGQSKLKLSGNGNGCKPLTDGDDASIPDPDDLMDANAHPDPDVKVAAYTRPLYSST